MHCVASRRQIKHIDGVGYNLIWTVKKKMKKTNVVAYSFHSFNIETLEDIEMMIPAKEIRVNADFCECELKAAVLADIRKNHKECVQYACVN